MPNPLANIRLPAALTDLVRRRRDGGARRPAKRVPFKESLDFAARKSRAEYMCWRFPDTVPLIVEKAKKSRLNDLEKRIIAVSRSFTIGEFFFVIAKLIKLDPYDMLFIMVDGQLPPTNQTLGSLYAEKHDEDMFLYVLYTEKNRLK